MMCKSLTLVTVTPSSSFDHRYWTVCCILIKLILNRNMIDGFNGMLLTRSWASGHPCTHLMVVAQRFRRKPLTFHSLYFSPTNSKDYIHRVGRTARAGRAGKSITMVCQYDVEIYQKIEAAIGKKLEEWPHEKDQIMVLKERVDEAKRIAEQEIKVTC